VERDDRQDVEILAAEQADPLDHIEAVELGPPSRDLGQVPPAGRCLTADPVTIVERPAALQDPADRADRRQSLATPESLLERAPDRDRAVLPEDALLAEGLANLDDDVLELGAAAAETVRGRAAVRPVDLVERTISRAGQPQLDRGQADPTSPADRPLARSRPDHGDDLATASHVPVDRCFSPPSSLHRRFVRSLRDRDVVALSDRDVVTLGRS